MKCICLLSIFISVSLLAGCNGYDSASNNVGNGSQPQYARVIPEENTPELPAIRCDISVWANRSKTNIRVRFMRDHTDPSFASELANVGVLLNNHNLERVSESSEIIEFSSEAEGYLPKNAVILEINNKRYTYELELEPIDLKGDEPFVFHQSQSNEILLSRPYTEDNELWLGIFDNYIGGFKEIAQFNERKTAIVIPASVSERMSVGNSRIELSNAVFHPKEYVKDSPVDISVHVAYSSEIKLQVIR